jgi:hypothetical protein
VEDIDMSEIEGMNMVEEQDHPTRGGVYGYDGYPYGGGGGMDTVEEYYHLMNHRPEVKGMDKEDSGMWEDVTVEVEVVEREHGGVMLTRH